MSKKKQRFSQPKPTNSIRNGLYNRLLYIGIGMVLLLPNWEAKGLGSFVAFVGFILILYQCALLIFMAQFIVDDFFPPKRYYEVTPNGPEKHIYYLSSAMFMGGLLALIFEIRTIDNTIHGMSLFWRSVLVGLAIALLLTFVIKKYIPSVYEESKRRFSVNVGFFFGLSLLVPALASFMNHTFADPAVTCTPYEIRNKTLGGEDNDLPLLFLKLKNGEEERFEVYYPVYDQVTDGGQVKLCTKKGLLNFEVVEEFTTIEK